MPALLRLYYGSIAALLRHCTRLLSALILLNEACLYTLLRLYEASIKALLRLYYGSIKALLRLCTRLLSALVLLNEACLYKLTLVLKIRRAQVAHDGRQRCKS